MGAIRPRRLAAATSMATVAVASRALAQGCAMCGSSITPDDPLAQAINTSVLFLMAAPYALVGGAALWLFMQHRRRLVPSPSDPKED